MEELEDWIKSMPWEEFEKFMMSSRFDLEPQYLNNHKTIIEKYFTRDENVPKFHQDFDFIGTFASQNTSYKHTPELHLVLSNNLF